MAGASIVSFNQPSFTSFGKDQGANAPVSEQAAFAYTTALNDLLRHNGPQNVQIGDAATVYWAEAADAEEAEAAERVVPWLIDPPSLEERDTSEVKAITNLMELVQKGKPLENPELHLKPGTKFYILGLAPNAARPSGRRRRWVRSAMRFTTTGATYGSNHCHGAKRPPPSD
jgi:CRISPR-associated protein Csd1